MEGEGLLVTNEIHPARAKILSENVERMGIRNACVLNETPEHLADIFEEYFDRILVDAPRSGEGMLRKNEVACEEWSPRMYSSVRTDRTAFWNVPPGCWQGPAADWYILLRTFASAENEGSISRFLAKHEEFEIVPLHKKAPGIPEGCDGIPGCVENPATGIEGTLRLWPHKASEKVITPRYCRRRESFRRGISRCAQREQKKESPQRTCEGLGGIFCFRKRDFFGEADGGSGLCTAGEGFLAFGDNLYRMPERMPGVKGLKVLRPGLHLGTLKKNRFEPAHALALALCPKDVKHVRNVVHQKRPNAQIISRPAKYIKSPMPKERPKI